MKLCINCYYCKVHCQCNYPQWCKKVNYCCEKCEAADSRIAELEAQLTAAQADIKILQAKAGLDVAELQAEIARLWQIAYNGEYTKARNWGADHQQADAYAMRVAGEKR